MHGKKIQFGSKAVSYYFEADFSQLGKLVSQDQTVIITDENIFSRQKNKFKGWKTIVIRSGEKFKVQATIDEVIHQLIDFKADRKTFLVGVGGGVVTDITGFAGSVYMRGLSFGFVPTSILAMVDASIGGKNGIDVGIYKNLVGIIRQPEFLLFDISLLKSLPSEEWVNGFAEIIKHACIKDAAMFRDLQKNSLAYYKKNTPAFTKLIRRNVLLKSSIVQKDELENGDRRLLNFGHTIGHAIENLYMLPHGKAISIGMVAACMISEELSDFKNTASVIEVLNKYGLPTQHSIDARRVVELLRMDKKKVQDKMHYVLLSKIGNAVVKTIPVSELEKLLYSIVSAR